MIANKKSNFKSVLDQESDDELPFMSDSVREEFERWLRGPVVEAYDEMEADPSRGIPIEKAFEEIWRRIDLK